MECGRKMFHVIFANVFGPPALARDHLKRHKNDESEKDVFVQVTELTLPGVGLTKIRDQISLADLRRSAKSKADSERISMVAHFKTCQCISKCTKKSLKKAYFLLIYHP